MLAALTALFCLAGCGSKFEGEWHCVEVSDNGETIKASDFKDKLGYDEDEFCVLEIDNDGTGTYSECDGDYKLTFEWEIDDDEITLDIDDKDAEFYGKLKDDQLVLTYSNEKDLKMVFEKD